MDARNRVCMPVTWEQYDGTTVYKCKNMDDSIVTYDVDRFAYCPLCGGRVKTDDINQRHFQSTKKSVDCPLTEVER